MNTNVEEIINGAMSNYASRVTQLVALKHDTCEETLKYCKYLRSALGGGSIWEISLDSEEVMNIPVERRAVFPNKVKKHYVYIGDNGILLAPELEDTRVKLSRFSNMIKAVNSEKKTKIVWTMVD